MKNLVGAIGISLLTALILCFFIEKQSNETILQIDQDPQKIAQRFTGQTFVSLCGVYLQKHFSLETNTADTVLKILKDRIFISKEYRESERTEICICENTSNCPEWYANLLITKKYVLNSA